MITNLKESECINILENNYVGQLSYIYIERPFIVPMTYFFDKKNSIVGYSEEGHKTKAMRNYRKVSLQVSEKADNNTCNSVLVHGIYEELSGSVAKKYLHDFTEGIKAIILKNEHRNLHCISDFSNKRTQKKIPIVFRITVDEMTGKKITNESL
ncbi:pyridoxamine 5'-phosphate oxidase family protein [Polaribacter undariae]|uniref:Pyridoxamine 5'-phosphate oxidase family protein n=1 Tax=Polaribacter sejongensis TaxID=985043 RepID=A0AAJ1QUY4_9FLAO|nr:pyridoxamine 5'-phosphate oxidase family protein [Polaribacter undariae]MDN3618286.1 pyridoxamine 5'-phosphate oxidase family protein [Polaribacter undariae]UWD30726.1 pyridoxamine 5'-phosphate oxidase family protein [Polaribacter undariae]